jgi:hypothetical protein
LKGLSNRQVIISPNKEKILDFEICQFMDVQNLKLNYTYDNILTNALFTTSYNNIKRTYKEDDSYYTSLQFLKLKYNS